MVADDFPMEDEVSVREWVRTLVSDVVAAHEETRRREEEGGRGGGAAKRSWADDEGAASSPPALTASSAPCHHPSPRPSRLSDPRASRLASLHAWQRFYGMEPREDSRLSEKWASGALDGVWTVDCVARELMATHFLFHATLYGELQEEYMRHVADGLRRRVRGLTWTETWDVVRFYAPTALKLQCLLCSGVAIPPRLPPEAA